MNQTLLVEILTEELPPKALMKLADSFASTIESSLKQEDFLNDTSKTTIYATPRRLAVTITDVRDVSPDKTVRQKVLPVNVALDADGQSDRSPEKETGCIEHSGYRHQQAGKSAGRQKRKFLLYLHGSQDCTGKCLAKSGRKAAHDLPVPKMMTYQRPDGETVEFVRPVHEFIAMHGENVLPITLLGLSAGRITHGHRFFQMGISAFWRQTIMPSHLKHAAKSSPAFNPGKNASARC